MSSQSRSEERIRAAIDSLIAHIVPTNPYEDDDSAQERIESTVELVSTILKE